MVGHGGRALTSHRRVCSYLSEPIVAGTIDLIFEKALKEQKYAGLYAQLCFVMSEVLKKDPIKLPPPAALAAPTIAPATTAGPSTPAAPVAPATPTAPAEGAPGTAPPPPLTEITGDVCLARKGKG